LWAKALLAIPARILIVVTLSSKGKDNEMRRALIWGAAVALAITASAYVAFAEDAPKDNQGYTTPKTVVLELGNEIPSMAGWQLRLRVLNIAPGGHIGLHSHKDRPSVVYFDKGTDVVINEDGSSKTFRPGDTTAEGVNTVHWHKNTGNDAVVIYTADLVKAQPK
jgi:quercetin dioxygenase-like cupin family protein